MILYYILVPLAWLVFHIGFRVRCEGRENLKKIGTKGCIIAPNHISAIDPVFVVITRFWGQRMTVFAKKELFEINPFLSWFFRCAGAVCVRGTKEEVSVIEDTVKKCQEGGTLLLFPEGTREQEGKFLPLKTFDTEEELNDEIELLHRQNLPTKVRQRTKKDGGEELVLYVKQADRDYARYCTGWRPGM